MDVRNDLCKMFDPSIDAIVKAVDSQQDAAKGKKITVTLISFVRVLDT